MCAKAAHTYRFHYKCTKTCTCVGGGIYSHFSNIRGNHYFFTDPSAESSFPPFIWFCLNRWSHGEGSSLPGLPVYPVQHWSSTYSHAHLWNIHVWVYICHSPVKPPMTTIQLVWKISQQSCFWGAAMTCSWKTIFEIKEKCNVVALLEYTSWDFMAI